MYEITYLDKSKGKANFGHQDSLYATLDYLLKKHPAAVVPYVTLQFVDTAYAKVLENQTATKAKNYPSIGWFGIKRIGTGNVYNDIDVENRQDCSIVFDRLVRLEKIEPSPPYIAEYFIHHPKVFADRNAFNFLVP